MEELIPVASKLQDVLGALGQNTNLDLPQIVVIGGQSSGKSSVLEAVVGRSFLPRGTGIVTRRPLVLQLFNTSGPDGDGAENDDALGGDEEAKVDSSSAGVTLRRDRRGAAESEPGQEWGEFLHQPGRRYYDFSMIRDEISRDTNRLAGLNSKGVSPTPIHLKIYSPHVLSLTMVDLPGLTKVAVQDQPEDIEEQIYQINAQYGSNPNAILLAVTGANTDLASSDALKLARELDPRGERTIGVLTKLDLMDPGTDASDILHNRVIPLRRGYIAVVNRGQRDIDADLSIRVGLRNEERFFRTHPVYSQNRSILGKCGTTNLARNLNGILIHHIRECLPELKIRIGNMMVDVQSELDALGSSEGRDDPNKLGGKLLGLLSKFSSNFSAMIDGRASNTNQHHDGMPSLPVRGGYGASSSGMAAGLGSMSPNPSRGTAIGAAADELYGGARISHIFHEVFGRSLNAVGAFDGLPEEEIRTTIGNANGTRPALFVPEISFDILVRRQIRRLEQPGVQCVDLVYDELQRIACQSEPTELTRYPNLRDRMMDVVSSLLKRSVGELKVVMENASHGAWFVELGLNMPPKLISPGPTQLWVSNLVRIELSYINTNHPDFIGGSRAVARLMEKMGNEKEAARREAAVAAAAASSRQQQGGETLTPVRERGPRESDVGGMGATPLSSSSLERYMAADEGLGAGASAPPQHVVVDRSVAGGSVAGGAAPSGGAAGNGDNGGIMNFIFRNNSGGINRTGHGGGMAGGTSSALSSSQQQQNRSSAHSHYSGMSVGGAGGPPAVVQLPQVPDTMRQTDAPPSDRERVETEIIKSLIESYFSIVRKNYIDSVPKTIMYFLVNHVKDELQNELVSELYREAEIGHLMREADDIAQRRRTCVEMKELLEKALEIVNEVRDYNSFAK